MLRPLTGGARGVAAALCGAAALAALAWPGAALAQRAGLGAAIELVDPEVLRVCADPNSMPYSNEKQEGYEQKLAELFAQKLGKSVSYTYFPQATGFVRLTLGAYKCDVIMSYPQSDELVQNTNAYYQSAYALVTRPGSDLAEVDSLSDPRLKGKRIGVVARTPPGTYMARNGLMATARPYHLMVDTRLGTATEQMVRDIESGEIDAGVLWGPIAGYYAKQAEPDLNLKLLLKETGGPPMSFRITMGVRASDQEWKRELNRLIQENQAEINKILLDFGVPLLDTSNKLITN